MPMKETIAEIEWLLRQSFWMLTALYAIAVPTRWLLILIAAKVGALDRSVENENGIALLAVAAGSRQSRFGYRCTTASCS